MSTYLIWIFGVQVNSVKQPVKSNSVGSGHVSHCWTSAFVDHFNHCFVILKNIQHRTKSRRLRVRRNMINITQIKLSCWVGPWFGFGCACLMWCYATSFLVFDLWCCWIGSVKNKTLLQPNPEDQELRFNPFVNLHREKEFQLLLNCVNLKFVSCTSNLLTRTRDFRKCTRVHLMLMLSLLDLQQHQNPETILICIVCAVFPT